MSRLIPEMGDYVEILSSGDRGNVVDMDPYGEWAHVELLTGVLVQVEWRGAYYIGPTSASWGSAEFSA